MNTLVELEEFGYLKRTRITDEKGLFGGYDYDVFETPQPDTPYPDFRDTDNRDTENRTQLNTKESITNKSITKDIYTPIVEMYHRICISLPKLREVTDKRKTVIKARLKQYSMEQIEEVFILAEASDSLKGANGKWNANFDWLMNENNFVKVLEGNYNNKTQPQQTKQSNYDSFMSGLAEFVKENS
jgi:hypothetical protein